MNWRSVASRKYQATHAESFFLSSRVHNHIFQFLAQQPSPAQLANAIEWYQVQSWMPEDIKNLINKIAQRPSEHGYNPFTEFYADVIVRI